MGERPTGTVTFLFTDIVGSTRRWEEDPQAMNAELIDHDEILTAAIEAHDGWMVKHTGDGICAAFASATSAVDAAVQAQRLLRLPVRMGMSTGEAEARGHDYFGPALNRAARVMGAAHGGQILLASTTAGLVDLGRLVDLGNHRLRDLSGPQRLYQVRAEGLPDRFPPLQTLDAHPGNLPSQLTGLVGREADVETLTTLVRTHRLVTLTGVGGVGKTRLALQVAADLGLEFGDGAWLVELASVGDPFAVSEVVATTIGAGGTSGPANDRISEALHGRRMILLLDNCEHVLDAVADVVESVLARVSDVHVIATSREGLRVAGEQLWSVPPLPAAGPTSPAVQLFMERAAAARPGFALDDPAEAIAVEQICRRLDGIALAIELAAARVVSMSTVEVRDRLSDRFRLLTGARRGLQRHQTLRHAVSWSFDLLDEREREAISRWAVFTGGFDHDAAAALAGFADGYEVLDVLESLVRKSLLTLDRQGTTLTRYGMLETIREFAEDRLATSGGAAALRDALARYFAAEVATRWARYEPVWHERRAWTKHNLDNLRSAFRWALDRGELTTAADIAAHTAPLALFDQRFEPVAWAEEMLTIAGDAGLPHLARLHGAASLTLWRGDPERAIERAHDMLTLVGDERYLPVDPLAAHATIATSLLFLGRHRESLEVYDTLARQHGFSRVVGLCGLLYGLPQAGRSDEAIAIADETVTLVRRTGDAFHLCWALTGDARAHAEVDPDRARRAFDEALGLAVEHHLTIAEPVVARDMASLERATGNLHRALALLVRSMLSFHQAGDQGNLVVALADLIPVLHGLDEGEAAATLWGLIRGNPLAARVAELADHATTVAASLPDDRFAAAVERGRRMTLSDGVALVVDKASPTRD